jgi:hypothetical protein
MKAAVKIMRSYDYCHFEVALSTDEEMTLDQVNEMRKQAALLADEAVRQYKIAKKAEDQRVSREWQVGAALEQVKRIQAIPESDWTVEQAALMRSYEDQRFWKDLDEESYLYNEDPERDHHFSMLRRFQDVTITP